MDGNPRVLPSKGRGHVALPLLPDQTNIQPVTLNPHTQWAAASPAVNAALVVRALDVAPEERKNVSLRGLPAHVGRGPVVGGLLEAGDDQVLGGVEAGVRAGRVADPAVWEERVLQGSVGEKGCPGPWRGRSRGACWTSSRPGRARVAGKCGREDVDGVSGA
eukprot:358852-Chlamydomonas_euryale.AAC.1